VDALFVVENLAKKEELHPHSLFIEEIEVIPAVELTCQNESRELHILGYFIDYKDKDFLTVLKELKQQRRERIYEISRKLGRLGIHIEPEEVFSLCPEGSSVGRLHVARVLLNKGIVSSFKDAFRRFIGERSPGYVARFRFAPEEAISIIKKAGGIPVLAHPHKSNCLNILPHLVDAGLEGIEVFYSDNTPAVEDFYKNLAAKYGLLVTGGSDCHGFAKKEILMGKVKLPYWYVENMKERFLHS